MLARLTELGHHFGFHTAAPKTEERLWLSLGFAYMVVITALAWIASDGRGPLPAHAARAGGGQGGLVDRLLVFFIEADVFAYLLNGIVDGLLVFASLLLWSLAGRVGSPPRRPEGARRGCGPPSSGLCERSRRRWPRRRRPAAPAERRGPGRRAARPLPRRCPPARSGGAPALRAFEWLPFPWRFSRAASRPAPSTWRRSRARASRSTATCCCCEGARDDRLWPTTHASAARGIRVALRGGEGRPSRPRPGSVTCEPRGDGEECDVAIVGSGAGAP